MTLRNRFLNKSMMKYGSSIIYSQGNVIHQVHAISIQAFTAAEKRRAKNCKKKVSRYNLLLDTFLFHLFRMRPHHPLYKSIVYMYVYPAGLISYIIKYATHDLDPFALRYYQRRFPARNARIISDAYSLHGYTCTHANIICRYYIPN